MVNGLPDSALAQRVARAVLRRASQENDSNPDDKVRLFLYPVSLNPGCHTGATEIATNGIVETVRIVARNSEDAQLFALQEA